MAEEAVSFSPANLRKTITPVASFQVDTKREQDVIKVSTVQLKLNQIMQFKKNVHCKPEDAFILHFIWVSGEVTLFHSQTIPLNSQIVPQYYSQNFLQV